MKTEPDAAVPEITLDCGVPKTTSLEVARIFGKAHKNILRDIDVLLPQVSDSLGKLNFEPSEYETQNNLGFMVKQPMYKLTKDGFTMLAMGYTGRLAIRFKEAYIRRFNEMEAELSRRDAAVGTDGDRLDGKFSVTWEEWLAATHPMKDIKEERKRFHLIFRIEREALEGRR